MSIVHAHVQFYDLSISNQEGRLMPDIKWIYKLVGVVVNLISMPCVSSVFIVSCVLYVLHV